jgi:hypothetical protein
MNEKERHIELRVAYPGHPYVALLGRRSAEFGFERIFNPFYKGREFLLDGRQEQIHHLPDANLVYEIDELRNGKRTRWYAATVLGDPNIYRISRYGAEEFSKKQMSIREVIEQYPERPSLADFQDEEE